ncbi:hypothetical protein [Streptomyces arenae]|uniref:hypothetical protein n=1 Tax=Streptomyces arenae TaxID=29301 RepID=UPI00265B2487|nr:hypothetical protein [Streptomyces arenae]MCG7203992.1 hypothetical protein [Streptomyces arenae]
MTAHRRTARACLTGAGLTAASTAYAVTVGHPILAGAALYVSVFLAWCARCHYAGHRRQLAEADWEQQHVLGRTPPPLNPCCLLSRHGDGTAHDRRCTDLFHRLTTTDLRSST